MLMMMMMMMIMVRMMIVVIVNIFIVVIIFISAVCSTCRGAHYQSRKARQAGCFLPGEQVS